MTRSQPAALLPLQGPLPHRPRPRRDHDEIDLPNDDAPAPAASDDDDDPEGSGSDAGGGLIEFLADAVGNFLPGADDDDELGFVLCTKAHFWQLVASAFAFFPPFAGYQGVASRARNAPDAAPAFVGPETAPDSFALAPATALLITDGAPLPSPLDHALSSHHWLGFLFGYGVVFTVAITAASCYMFRTSGSFLVTVLRALLLVAALVAEAIAVAKAIPNPKTLATTAGICITFLHTLAIYLGAWALQRSRRRRRTG